MFFFFSSYRNQIKECRKGTGSKCERGLAETKTKCEKSGDTGRHLYIYLTTLLRGSVLDEKEKESPVTTHTKQTLQSRHFPTRNSRAKRIGPWKSPCGRWGTQRCDPQNQNPFLSRQISQRRPIKLTEQNSAWRRGWMQRGRRNMTAGLQPAPRSPGPGAWAPRPTPAQPTLPYQLGNQNACRRWIHLPPAKSQSRHSGPLLTKPATPGSGAESWPERSRGRGRPGGTANAPAHIPRTRGRPDWPYSAPSGLRPFAARATGRGLRAGLGLDGEKGRGEQEAGDWASTTSPWIWSEDAARRRSGGVECCERLTAPRKSFPL